MPADDLELIGGPEHRPIALAEPDPAWPARFETERRRILDALGERGLRVDHIGSTSIPGLAAKPIIDIQLSVADVDAEVGYLPALEHAGYRLRVRERTDRHRMLRTPALEVHLHVCDTGSDWERRHLLLRGWLRSDAADRAAYEALKRRLATQEWASMQDYADAKGDLIAEMTARAEGWASATGWSV